MSKSSSPTADAAQLNRLQRLLHLQLACLKRAKAHSQATFRALLRAITLTLSRLNRLKRLALAGLLVEQLLLPSSAAATEVPWTTPPAISTTALGTRSVATADMDGDGDLDALSASTGDNKIAWYENTAGDGSAWSLRTISTTASYATSVATADVDGDGDLDALSASAGDNKIAWYENTAGDGSVWSLHTIATTANGATSVTTADVDGDGDLDALSASYNDDKIAWYENTAGDGSAWTPRTIATTALRARSVTVADVDGDGDLDALSASFNDNKIAWYENSAGDGSAWTPRTIAITAAGATSVVTADVDGDGDLDALSASSGDNKIAWYENTAGDGSAWTPRTISTSAFGANSVTAADVDGDGDLDALSASLNDNKIAWYENSAGDGSAWTPRTISTSATGAYSVAAADVDGDGDLDALSASFNDNKIAWYRNETIHRSAVFVSPPAISTTANFAYSVVAADVDGDGDLDTLSASDDDNKIAWYENTAGDGSAWSLHIISTTANAAKSVAAADVDGDGDVDALSASFADNKIAWYENSAGDGSAWTLHLISTAAIGPESVAAADVDGDGDVDALSAARPDSEIDWYENTTGSGSAWILHTISTDAIEAASVTTADVDGDGDVDALSASAGDDKIAWYENSAGNGSAWTPHTIATTANYAVSVATADVDGDGDVDALSASIVDNKIAWYENSAGNGSAWIAHTISTTANQAASVSAADVDGDGDLDALSASSNDDKIAWYENSAGNGSAWTLRIIATADGAQSVAAADVDGDGDLDTLSASAADNKIAWYENRGGQFALPGSNTAPASLAEGSRDDLLTLALTHRGRAGDSDEELVNLQLAFDTGSGLPQSSPLTSAQANALFENLFIYRDANASGIFEISDTPVATITTLALSPTGEQTISFSDGAPAVQVSFGTPITYFVVAELTAAASLQTPNTWRVSHISVGPSRSTGEDRPHDIPLSLEFSPNLTSTVVQAISVANVSLTKTVSPVGPVQPGQPLTYTLAFSNAGSGLAVGIVLTDIVPISLANPIVTNSGAAITPTAGLTFSWQVANLSAGQGGVITISGLVSPGLITNTIFTNTAVISAANDNNPANNRPPGVPVTVNFSPRKLYLPLTFKDVSAGPDLVVKSLAANSNAISVVIQNQGSSPVVDAFWVDAYINPSAPPSLNRPWQTLSSRGVAWGITGPGLSQLGPGGVLTLTLTSPFYVAGQSNFGPPLALGSQVWAQVDTVDFNTSYGAVQEGNESNNVAGPILPAAGGATTGGEGSGSPAAPAELPARE